MHCLGDLVGNILPVQACQEMERCVDASGNSARGQQRASVDIALATLPRDGRVGAFKRIDVAPVGRHRFAVDQPALGQDLGTRTPREEECLVMTILPEPIEHRHILRRPNIAVMAGTTMMSGL